MIRGLLVVLFAVAIPLAAQDADRWEPAMQAFEKADQQAPPPKGGLVFIGSASIRRCYRAICEFHFLTVSRHQFSMDRDVAGDCRFIVHRLLRFHPDKGIQTFHPARKG